MPTYEYACSACGHQWEQTQRITEAPLEVCPKCSQSTAHRLISATNFILKGGGWYSDLYSSAKPAKSDGEGAAKTESSSSEKSETTSAASPAKTTSGESSASSSGGTGPSSGPGSNSTSTASS